MENKNDTLFGGRKIHVHLIDGSTEEWTVRQFRLKEYNAAYAIIDDEMALVAKACDKSRTELTDVLTPKAYEEVQRVMKEVNGEGFFPYAERVKERNAENLRLLPQEMLDRIMPMAPSTSLRPSPIGQQLRG